MDGSTLAILIVAAAVAVSVFILYKRKKQEYKPSKAKAPQKPGVLRDIPVRKATPNVNVPAVTPITLDPVPTVTPVQPPGPPSDGMAIDMTVQGEPILLKVQNNLVAPTKIVVSGNPGQRVNVECVVDMDYVGSPELLAQLVETQAFRDLAPLPGTAQVILTSWPYTNPRIFIEDVTVVGTDVVTRQLGGFARVLENSATHKSIYLANITENPVRFKFTLTLIIRSVGASYGLVRGQIASHYGDDRRRYFEIWLNNVNADL